MSARRQRDRVSIESGSTSDERAFENERASWSGRVGNVDEKYPMDRRVAIAIVERALGEASAAAMDLRPGLGEDALPRLPDPEVEQQVLAALRVDRRSRLTKRALDLLVASLGLVFVAPLLLVIALAIKLDSRGPVILPQKRLGRGRQPFACFKFRTMTQEKAPDAGSIWSARNDPRVTRVGRFLRPRGLDELPQLINILRGDMSLVGPRPFRPEVTGLLAHHVPFYPVRFLVQPGLTGWAQIKYRNSASLSEQIVKCYYDFGYISNQSISLDLYIMLRSVVIPFKNGGEGGYIARATEALLSRLERRVLEWSEENRFG